MRFLNGLGALAVVSVVSMAGSAWADGDADAGKTVFAKCAICHSVVAGQNKIGPSLFGIVGRPSASIPTFTYSEAMKNANKVWDEVTLDTYLENPRGVVPGTKMIFVGLKTEADRKNVIAYLATLK